MNTPNAENACRQIIASSLSFNPILRIMINCGTMYTCHGIAMVAMYAMNSTFLCLNSSFAKEYAAKLLVKSCKAVTTIVRNTVFFTNVPNGIFVQIST